MKFKKTEDKNTKLSWEEVQRCGTIVSRTFACTAKSADWHMIQMRNSPTLRNIKMEKNNA